jgi:hypothetical protein
VAQMRRAELSARLPSAPRQHTVEALNAYLERRVLLRQPAELAAEDERLVGLLEEERDQILGDAEHLRDVGVGPAGASHVTRLEEHAVESIESVNVFAGSNHCSFFS